MKAIQYTSFGDSSVLELTQKNKPSCGENDILIKVLATTVNPFDIKVRSGAMQKIVPVELPYVPGSDVAGLVEEVGVKVQRLKVGDAVIANTFGGSYAEYVSVHQDRVALKAKTLDMNGAVSLVVPVTTSYAVLIEKANLRAGQKTLIHGAAGGVGSCMLQMAKSLGAYVIGTASGKGVDLVKTLGADEVIDYKNQDFTQLVKDMDVVVDLVGKDTQVRSFGVLKKGGQLVSTVMPLSQELAQQHDVQVQFISATAHYTKLDFGNTLIEQGKIKAQVARVMKLEEAAEAQDLISDGGVNGKIVLEIN